MLRLDQRPAQLSEAVALRQPDSSEASIFGIGSYIEIL